MQKKYISSFLLTALMLSGCNGSDNDKTSTPEPQPVPRTSSTEAFDGIWVAQAYGEAIEIRQGIISSYQFTSQYCQQTDQESTTSEILTEQKWQQYQNPASIRQVVTDFGVHWLLPRYEKADQLPLSCQQALIKTADETGYHPDPARDYEIFWQTFNEYYPSFNIRNTDWETQKGSYQVTDDQSLYLAMATSITPLADSHVEIYPINSDGGYNVRRRPEFDLLIQDEFIATNGPITTEEAFIAYQNYAEEQEELVNAIRLSYAPDETSIRSAANDQLVWYTNTSNTGVMIIQNMAFFRDTEGEDDINPLEELQALKPAMDQAMADLSTTDNLIIDIRHNPGGFDAASQLIARYFLDTERHLYSKQARLGSGRTEAEAVILKPVDSPYLKPVVLLTSGTSTSAAEVFAMMMRELPHVSLIGEPTQGAIADVLEKQLPNGFRFELVNEYYMTPEGLWFEATGVPVDTETNYATLEQRQAGTDDGMNAALAYLNQTP